MIRRRRCATRVPASLIAILLPLLPAVAGAAEPVLSLEQAIAMALAASHEVAIAAAETEIARGDADIAGGRRTPHLDLTADWTLTTNPVLVFGNLLRQERFTAADFDIESLNDPEPLSNWNATAALSQVLYAGGSLSAGAEGAELEIEARLAEQERAGQHLRWAVVSTYADAVMAVNQLDTTRQILATAQAHEKLVGDLVGAGLAVAADLSQAQVRTAEAREAMVRAEGAAATAHAALNLMIGRVEDAPLTLVDGAQLAERLATDASRQALVQRALRARPDLVAARRRVEASTSGIDAASGARLPQVGLWAAFEANDREFFGAEGTNWTVMVQGRWSAFDGSARATELAQARIRNDQARRAALLLERDIRLEVFRMYTEMAAAQERLVQAQASVGSARASLSTVEDRYREGMVTLVELLDAQTSLTRSLARDIAARRDILMAAAALEFAVGEPVAAISAESPADAEPEPRR